MALRNWEGAYSGVPVTVLGASGFIGRWVARKLTQQGARLSLVVRHRESSQQVFAEYSIQGEVLEQDLANLDAVGDLLEEIRPSVIFNLAAYGVDPLESDPELAYRLNAHLVEAIARSVPQRPRFQWPGQALVHVGSMAEYGSTGGALSEDSPAKPATLYGRSKLAGTTALARCCKTRQIKGLTARLFSVYGPGERSGRLLPSLLATALTGEPLALTSGKQARDFTYVGDVAQGLLRLGLSRARPGQVVNLATGRATSVREFVEVAATVLNLPPSSLQFGATSTPGREQEWNMQCSPATVERLRRLTGWVPPTGIEEGIRQTLEYQSMDKPEDPASS